MGALDNYEEFLQRHEKFRPALESLEAAAAAGSLDDLAVTNAKLAADVKVGSLASLTTTAKTSVQAAVNELDGDVGDKSTLTTTAKTSLVAAVNELDGEIGVLSSLETVAKNTLVAAINEVNGKDASQITLTGTQTLTNKTLTSPNITTPKIDDGDLGVVLTSANQTNVAPVVTIPDIADAADTFIMADTTQTLTNKTLTTPVIASFYQDAGKTKLMTTPNTASDTLCAIAAAQELTNKILTSPSLLYAIEAAIDLSAADVTLSSAQKIKHVLEVSVGHAANAIIAPAESRMYVVVNNDASNNALIKVAAGSAVTIPPSTVGIVYYNGTNYILVACEQVTLAGAQTLTNKTLTSPKVTQYVASHNYSGAADDWTLSASELLAQIITVSNANGVVNAIFNVGTPNYYLVYNNSGFALTCKNAAGSTYAIPNGKHAFIYNDGTNIVAAIDISRSPVLFTPLIDDGDAGCTITSTNQTNAAATATIPDIGDAADEFVMKDTSQVLTNKTLTAPILNNAKIGDGDTHIEITSANQTHATPVITIPDIVDAADGMVLNDTAATLTNKTLTAPVITSPDITFGVSAHNYGSAHADWTLSGAEAKSFILTCTNSDQASNILAPATAGKVFMVYNGTGSNIVILVSGQTGVTIATLKTALVRCDGTDYVRVTTDA